MAMDNMPEQAQGEGQSQGPQGGGDVLVNMITQTDRALSGLAQVLGKASPEAGQALGQLADQFRQVITAVMNQGQSQQQAPQMASPETQGKDARPAY
jgi:hypothetical protein